MQRNAMSLFALLFFGSLPIWAILLIVSIFSPGISTGKAAGVLTILLFTGLFGMVGLNILERFSYLKKLGGGQGGAQGPHVP